MVGAERLLSWNYAIAAKAMQVLQDLAMQLLSGPDDGSQDRSTGGSGPGGCSSWVNGAAYVLSGGISLAATGQTSAAAGPAGGALVGGGGGGKEAAAGGGGCTGCGNTAGVLTLVFPDSDSAVSVRARNEVIMVLAGIPCVFVCVVCVCVCMCARACVFKKRSRPRRRVRVLVCVFACVRGCVHVRPLPLHPTKRLQCNRCGANSLWPVRLRL